MSHRAFKYRIYAGSRVEEFFSQTCGIVRLFYNIALEQRTSFWRQYKRVEGKQISFASQCKELTALRGEFPWIAACPIDAQQQALRDLDQAFRSFFAGRTSYPKRRRKFVNEAFRIPSSRIGSIKVLNSKWAQIKLPKVGSIKFRYTRPIFGTVGNVTIIRDMNGWHISFGCDFEHETSSNDGDAVGIDRGIINTFALSTGELFSMPDTKLDCLYRQWQRVAARRLKNSKRQTNAERHAAKIAAKQTRRRKHWQHVHTSWLAQRFGTVVIERLKVKSMMASAAGTVDCPGTRVAQKRGLNRAISLAAWFRFELFLTYKLDYLGGKLIKVDPRYTSVTCAECGSKEKGNRENQAKFSCLSCGHEDHADVNAAINILAAGTRPSLASGNLDARRELRRAAQPPNRKSSYAKHEEDVTQP